MWRPTGNSWAKDVLPLNLLHRDLLAAVASLCIAVWGSKLNCGHEHNLAPNSFRNAPQSLPPWSVANIINYLCQSAGRKPLMPTHVACCFGPSDTLIVSPPSLDRRHANLVSREGGLAKGPAALFVLNRRHSEQIDFP